MGMQAELMAFGPFSDEVRDHLDYPSDSYDGVQDGVIVVGTPVRCSGSTTSRALAGALGFDAWDFNQHFLGELSVRHLAGLKAFLRDEGAEFLGDEFARSAWEEIKVLSGHGFKFIFRPHG